MDKMSTKPRLIEWRGSNPLFPDGGEALLEIHPGPGGRIVVSFIESDDDEGREEGLPLVAWIGVDKAEMIVREIFEVPSGYPLRRRMEEVNALHLEVSAE